MVTIRFTENIQRHVTCLDGNVEGTNVREALDNYFAGNEEARSYVVDEQGALRHHMVIFVDGAPVKDRVNLSDTIEPNTELHVFQALSGG